MNKDFKTILAVVIAAGVMYVAWRSDLFAWLQWNTPLGRAFPPTVVADDGYGYGGTPAPTLPAIDYAQLPSAAVDVIANAMPALPRLRGGLMASHTPTQFTLEEADNGGYDSGSSSGSIW